MPNAQGTREILRRLSKQWKARDFMDGRRDLIIEFRKLVPNPSKGEKILRKYTREVFYQRLHNIYSVRELDIIILQRAIHSLKQLNDSRVELKRILVMAQLARKIIALKKNSTNMTRG